MTTDDAAAWEQDKGTLIANFLVLLYPGASNEEYLALAEPLWELEQEALFRLIDEAMMVYLPSFSPLRQMRRA